LNLDQQVYELLREMIFRYELIPGQKLLYQDLADRLEVSRTPVKNALNFLEKDGLVKLLPNKGFYVAELSIEEAEELFSLRLILETEAVKLAARKCTDSDYAELLEIQKRYENAIEQELNRGRFLIDRDFHLQIAMMSGNKALYKHLKQVIEIVFLKHRIEGLSKKRGHEVRKEHRSILEHIKNKDETGAVQSLTYHIQRHRENVESIL